MNDLLPELLLGPYDGHVAPFGSPHNSRLILPSCPERKSGGPYVEYLWVEAATAWVYCGYVNVAVKSA